MIELTNKIIQTNIFFKLSFLSHIILLKSIFKLPSKPHQNNIFGRFTLTQKKT